MKINTRQIVMSGLLGAVSILLGVTRLGFIGPFPPLILVSATILQIPAIIGGILEGPLVGLLVGLVFGVSSWLQAPTEQPPVNLWFSNPFVSILPRLFIGVVAGYVYRAIKGSNERVAIVSAAILGTLTNTVLVIGAIILFGYAPYAVIIPSVLPNTIAEVIVAVIVVSAVIFSWKGISTRKKTGSDL